MVWLSKVTKAMTKVIALSILSLIGGLLLPCAVQADGGIAISGSFSHQDFHVPQGSKVSGPSIDVVVFNNSSDEIKVKMTSQAPVGVSLSLSQIDLTMAPGSQKQVFVSVAVTKDASPGQYEISVSAESYKNGVSGIQLAGAARQTAKLTVTGESASVTVQAVSPEGSPLVATVRLNRVIAGQSHEVAFTDTGKLEATVAPGDFTSACYIGGREVAQGSFTVATNEKKQVTLSAATVYFEGFGIVPNTQKDTGKMASIHVVYTVRNLYQRVNKGEVILQVNHDGTSLEPLSLAALNPLEMGSVGLNYNYIPSSGWVDGTYDFKLQLNLDNKPYANSSTEHLTVSGSAPVSGDKSPKANGGALGGGTSGGMNLSVIGIICTAIVLVGVLIFLSRRKWGKRV